MSGRKRRLRPRAGTESASADRTGVAQVPGKQFGLLGSVGMPDLDDEIQSIAARRFLPRVDYRIDRERMHKFGSAATGKVWVIANGDYLRTPENWPPSQYVRPLWISLHISPSRGERSGLTPLDTMLTQPAVKCLKGYGPVGARDAHTFGLLRSADVESYLSGCLTLTLERPPVERDHDLIVLNDVPEAVATLIRRQILKAVLETSHSDPEEESESRYARARALLNTYARAGCVITTRLHCALPCLAFGTPVLLLDTAANRLLCSGLSDLFHHCSVDDLLAGEAAFDVASPPSNLDRHVAYAEALRARVADFVAQPDATDPYPLPLTLSDRYTILAANQGRALRSPRQSKPQPAIPASPVRRKTVLLQTSDAHVYAPILHETARVNRAYCARHGLEYQCFIGIKRGYHPWQATFNRIPLLFELAQAGDVGWVVYLDADAYVFDLAFDVQAYLSANAHRACIVAPGSAVAKWDVNAGVLFVNLQHMLGRKLVEAWAAAFAAAISDEGLLASAGPWSAGVDDQILLQRVLRDNRDILDATLVDSSETINYATGSFIRQILRSSVDSLPLRLQWTARDAQIALSRSPDANALPANHIGLQSTLYTFLFEQLRNRFCSMLFIGRLVNVSGLAASSIPAIEAAHFDRIKAWLNFLPNTHCFDINEVTPEQRKLSRISIIRPRSAASPEWGQIAGKVPPLSIVVDTCAHGAAQQQRAFLALFPRLCAGGHYAFERPAGRPEDMHGASEPVASIANVFLGFVSGGTLAMPGAPPSDIDECTRRIAQVYIEREIGEGSNLGPVQRLFVVANN